MMREGKDKGEGVWIFGDGKRKWGKVLAEPCLRGSRDARERRGDEEEMILE